MTKEIEGIPEGWEFVGIRRAKKGEFSVAGSKPEPKEWGFDSTSVYPIIRKLPEPLKVAVGKYYKQRCGEIVGPLIEIEDSRWPFTTKEQYGDQWNIAGKRCLDGYEHTDLVEEVPAPAPKYRPFANAAEFKPHRHKWMVRKENIGSWKAYSYTDSGVFVGSGNHTTYAELLNWKFEDGTPCGVKQ